MKNAVGLLLGLILFVCAPFLSGQAVPAVGHTLLVIPFENSSPTPGLEWLGEAFPEALRSQLNSPVLYVAGRQERLRAYDRLGIPATLHPSRATIYRVTEQMDVDYAVLGSYAYDGSRLTVHAQLLDMRAQRLLPEATESGPLAELGNLQSALAWDVLRLIRTDFSIPKDKYVAGIAPVRLDAFESYIRAMLAATTEEKVRRYKDAVRLNPAYAEAWLELGKTYFTQRSYEPALAAFAQIPASSPMAREANFYLGLAAYYHSDFAKAEAAFAFVAERLPMAEVYNNLGVVNVRRGHKNAAEFFQKAIQNDPADPDYHFNLGIALSRTGDSAGAVRELRAAVQRNPGDSETQSVLDALTPSASSPSSPAPNAPKASLERIKRNYEGDSFRLMALQVQTWAEQRFARSDPRTHARFHVERGTELLSHGFAAEAENDFREASTLDPTSVAALTGLAEVLEARGNAAAARSQASASLQVHESAAAYLVLARLDLGENKLEEAAQNADRALQLEPGDSAALELKRAIAAKLAEKAQPLPQP